MKKMNGSGRSAFARYLFGQERGTKCMAGLREIPVSHDFPWRVYHGLFPEQSPGKHDDHAREG